MIRLGEWMNITVMNNNVVDNVVNATASCNTRDTVRNIMWKNVWNNLGRCGLSIALNINTMNCTKR
jgi:hypothetical protein